MPSYYTYLIASLPMLNFGMKPPFSLEKFIQYCQDFISAADAEALKKVSITPEYLDHGLHPTLKRWQEIDTVLRNELAKIRAAHQHLDPQKYLRPTKLEDTFIAYIAISSHRAPQVLEAEKMLDQERWRRLEELAFSHYFDLDFLLIYALKLLILGRWEKESAANKREVLEAALKEV